jgi:hypothetical protein
MYFKRMLYKLLIPFLFSSFLLSVVEVDLYPQNLTPGIKSQFLNNSKHALEDTVNKRTQADFPFIIGRFHEPVINNFRHPYFNENKWISGSLFYDGRIYKAGNLKYDIEKDKLIYLMYTQDFVMNTIALDENFIPEFCILDITFKYYTNKDVGGIKAGYFEVVFDGDLKFLVRLKKSEPFGDKPYNVSAEMFLLKDGQMIRIKSIVNLINQLKDKKKEVERFVKDNNLTLSQSDYSSASKVLTFYLSLQKK